MPEISVHPSTAIQINAAEYMIVDDADQLSTTYRMMYAIRRAVNRSFPYVRKLTLATVSLSAAISTVELTRRLISASIQDVVKPPPITDQEVRGLKGEIIGVGLFFGVAGGGAAGLATGSALKLFASFCNADSQDLHNVIFYCVAFGLLSGALGGVAYTNFVDITLENITPDI